MDGLTTLWLVYARLLCQLTWLLSLLLRCAGNAIEQSRMYGRHFDHNDQLVSKITRESINALKSHFADEMTKDDWRLVSQQAAVCHA
jgi:hypothetical protein